MLRVLMRIGIINVEFNLKLAQTKEEEKKHCSKVNINYFASPRVIEGLSFNADFVRIPYVTVPLCKKVCIERDHRAIYRFRKQRFEFRSHNTDGV